MSHDENCCSGDRLQAYDESYYASRYACRFKNEENIYNYLLVIAFAYLRNHAPNLLILDLGCGVGKFSESILRKLRHAVISLDISRIACCRTKSRLKDSSDVVRADARELPFKDEIFSIVVAKDIVEHIKDESKLLREASRILSRQGIFVVLTPNIWGYQRLYYAITRRSEHTVFDDPTHVNLFNQPKLKQSLLAAGFSDIKFINRELPLSLLNRAWFRNRILRKFIVENPVSLIGRLLIVAARK